MNHDFRVRPFFYLAASAGILAAVGSGCVAFNEDCAAPSGLEDPDTVIGFLARPLSVSQSLVRTREMAIGTLITDAYMDAYNNPENPSYREEVEPVDGAFENSGAIREQGFCEPVEELPGDPDAPPPIRRMDLREVIPFTNRVVVVELTSSEVWDVLEHSVSALAGSNPERGHFLQVSGISFEVDCTLDPYERVVAVSIGDESLHPGGDTIWRLATNDFLLQAEGNDGFETLAGRPRHNSLGQFSFEVVEDYLTIHSSEDEPYDPPEPPLWMELVACE